MTQHFNEDQISWLKKSFMAKLPASLWLGVISLLLVLFSFLTGRTYAESTHAQQIVEGIRVELSDHEKGQAYREGTVDATLKSINVTLGKLEAMMEDIRNRELDKATKSK